MIERELPIVNKLGLHARAAAKFVALASRFASRIEVSRNRRRVNGKSIMGVMMLAAARGTTITLHIDGPDEQAAAAALEQLVRERFGEAE